MKTKLVTGITWCILAGSLFVGEVQAYEEIPVTDGGRLSGTITLTGDLPRPKGYNLVTFPDPVYCGRISDGRGWRLLQTFHVGANQAFQDVVVVSRASKEESRFCLRRRAWKPSTACLDRLRLSSGTGTPSKW